MKGVSVSGPRPSRHSLASQDHQPRDQLTGEARSEDAGNPSQARTESEGNAMHVQIS